MTSYSSVLVHFFSRKVEITLCQGPYESLGLTVTEASNGPGAVGSRDSTMVVRSTAVNNDCSLSVYSC